MALIPKTEDGFTELGISHVCICGSKWWNIQACFDDYQIAGYLLDMTCAVCSNKATAPTEVDRD